MDSMPVAFSVHNFISSVGADAGFAAIIGLAVLVLLYFSHARETANLREEASILAERLQQAEARVSELSRPQSVGAAVPAAQGVQVTDQRAAALAAAAPFAPAGVGAPALAAATRVVPLPALPAPSAAPAPALAMAAAPGATASAAASPPVLPPPASPPPNPVAGGAAATAPSRPSGIPAPATAAGANGGGRGSSPTAPAADDPPRAVAPSVRPLPPLSAPARSRGGAGRRIAIGLGALVLLAGAVAALVVITGSTSSRHSPPLTQTTNAPTATRAAAFSAASVTVAVLNGTATNQLAHRVAAKLASSGYKEGRVATAANQTQTATVVAYLPGTKNRADALHVATALKLKPSSVQPIDQGTQQVACPPPGACANVVVTVGADLATL